MKIPIDELKIFEVKCDVTPVSQLPYGAKGPRYDTDFERIKVTSPNFENQTQQFRHHIAGVMMARDAQEFMRIENLHQLNKTDKGLKQQFDDCLKRFICTELVQIKDFIKTDDPHRPGQHTWQVELRTTRTGSAG